MCPEEKHAVALRFTAGAIAVAAAAGFFAGYDAVLGRIGSYARATAIMLSYFTNLTALLVAALFLSIGLIPVRRLRPRLVAGAGLAVLLVGLVQQALLAGPHLLSGGDLVADILLHKVLPVSVPLFWLAFMPKGHLRYGDALLWALYPLAFLAVTLLRGAATGWYPYPFIDVTHRGWPMVLGYLGGIAAGFLLVGLGFITLDRKLARSPHTEL